MSTDFELDYRLREKEQMLPCHIIWSDLSRRCQMTTVGECKHNSLFLQCVERLNTGSHHRTMKLHR